MPKETTARKNKIDSSFAMQVDTKLADKGQEGISVRQVGLLNKMHNAATCKEKVEWMAAFIEDFRKSTLSED
ncbi:hypothetical protein ITP31_004784 [Salmonella enterica]|nr:hypothetical protein [Salmonella enterica]